VCVQLRWYDSVDDSASKGDIDLSEVELVRAVGGRHVQGAPKKADENGFFEVTINMAAGLHGIAIAIVYCNTL